MLKLKNIYQNVKRHARKIAVGTVIIGALAGMRSCAKNMGEEIYRGNINGQQVVYREKEFSWGGPLLNDFPVNERNIMIIVDANKTYTLIDSKGETNIDWKNDIDPNFKADELEEIIIKNGGEKKFHSFGKISEWKPSTIDERHSKSVFERGNEMYNNLRKQIRDQLRAQYEAQPNPLE